MKRILCLLLTLVMCMSLVACGGESTNNAENTTQVTNDKTNSQNNKTETENVNVKKIDKNIDSVATELGLTDGSETLYSFIGAIAGKEYNGGDVELYQFEENSDAYKQIIEGEILKISAYKDGIVLLFPDGIEEDANLVNAFESLEFK